MNLLMKESKDIGIVFLDRDGIGTLIMPNTVNLIKDSHHSENAKKLIDFLLSREVEAKLALSCAQMPLHKGIKLPKGVYTLDNIKAMDIDYDKTSKKLEEIQEYLKNWVEEN